MVAGKARRVGGRRRGPSRSLKYVLNQVRSTPRKMRVGSNPPPIAEQPTGSLTLSFATTAATEEYITGKSIITAFCNKTGIPNTSEAFKTMSVRLRTIKLWNNGQGGRVYLTHMPTSASSRTFSDEGTFGRAAGIGIEIPEVLRSWRIHTDETKLAATTTSAAGRLYVNFDFRFTTPPPTSGESSLRGFPLASYQ